MRSIVLATLALFLLLSPACTVGPDDPIEPDDDVAVQDDDPPRSEPTSSVAPGCYPNTNCTGPKTCGAWTAYAACAAPFQACHPQCGFPTRFGCNVQGTVTPQNRSRTCTMHATGATCLERDYREVLTSCPF